MTEEEAKTKWCFQMALAFGSRQSMDEPYRPADACCCIGSACMAWRWDRILEPSPEASADVRVGYCGLAGAVR